MRTGLSGRVSCIFLMDLRFYGVKLLSNEGTNLCIHLSEIGHLIGANRPNLKDISGQVCASALEGLTLHKISVLMISTVWSLALNVLISLLFDHGCLISTLGGIVSANDGNWHNSIIMLMIDVGNSCGKADLIPRLLALQSTVPH